MLAMSNDRGAVEITRGLLRPASRDLRLIENLVVANTSDKEPGELDDDNMAQR
jgi:hypothetical protein